MDRAKEKVPWQKENLKFTVSISSENERNLGLVGVYLFCPSYRTRTKMKLYYLHQSHKFINN